jgi:uncharacterized protein YbbK (DUF523 family)
MEIKPLVGVSQCLLGDAVRYDGKSKANQVVLKHLSQIFELIPICPEVEAGLGIPRPPVQLTTDIENPRLTGRDDASIDITDVMKNYCHKKPLELKHLDGFIFKSRSPSCGLNSTPVFINNQCATENSRGVFARSLVNQFPNLPSIEDCTFTKESINHFIKQVLQYTLTD